MASSWSILPVVFVGCCILLTHTGSDSLIINSIRDGIFHIIWPSDFWPVRLHIWFFGDFSRPSVVIGEALFYSHHGRHSILKDVCTRRIIFRYIFSKMKRVYL